MSRSIPRGFVLAAAVALSLAACERGGGRSSPFASRLVESRAVARPGPGDDEIVLVFEGLVEGTRAASRNAYAFESPPGLELPLAEAAIEYDARARTVRLVLGDRVNLVPGSPYVVRASVPDFSESRGVVGGAGAPPAIDLLVPALGFTAGGDRVAVRGRGFTRTGDTRAFLGGTPVEALEVEDGRSLAFVTPRARPGAADLVIETGNGGGTLAGAFVYAAPFPQIEGPLAFVPGEGPVSAALGPLDGDDCADLVCANLDGSDLAVFRGRGNGDFDPPVKVPSGNGASHPALADLDGDGDLDAVVSCGRGNAVAVHAGDGGALLFGPPRLHSVAAFPQGLVVADLDRDGSLDAAVACRVGDAVSVLYGDGAGGFADRVDTTSVLRRPTGVHSADFDADGVPDLAVANDGVPGSVSILFGDGARGFAARGADLPTEGGASAVDAADLDGDGTIDLAVAHRAGSGASVFLGIPGGAFAERAPVAVGSGASAILSSDLDADARPDLLVVTTQPAALHALAGDGRGGFRGGRPVRVGSAPTGLAAGQIDRDAFLDAAVVNSVQYTVAICLGTESGAFLAQHVAPSSGAFVRPSAFGALDVDRDGLFDLAIADDGRSAVVVLRNTGGLAFEETLAIPFPGGTGDLFAGDLDGDRIADLVVVDPRGRALVFLPGDGSGGFGTAIMTPLPNRPARLASADFDSDGVLDLSSHLVDGREILVAFGDGRGGFGRLALVPDAGGSPAAAAPSDLDGDGAVDLVVTERIAVAGQVVLLRGDGLGGFSPAGTFPLDVAPSRLALADVTRDGRKDILVAGDTPLEAAVVTFANAGGFAFEERSRTAIGRGASGLRPVDFDRDGHVDVVAAAQTSAILSLLRGNSTGGFTTLSLHVAGGTPASLLSADLDGDGSPDFAILDPVSRIVLIFRNRG